MFQKSNSNNSTHYERTFTSYFHDHPEAIASLVIIIIGIAIICILMIVCRKKYPEPEENEFFIRTNNDLLGSSPAYYTNNDVQESNKYVPWPVFPFQEAQAAYAANQMTIRPIGPPSIEGTIPETETNSDPEEAPTVQIPALKMLAFNAYIEYSIQK